MSDNRPTVRELAAELNIGVHAACEALNGRGVFLSFDEKVEAEDANALRGMFSSRRGMPKGHEAKRGYGPQRIQWQQRGRSSN